MSEKKIHAAVIGSGRWGINHVRTAASLLGKCLKYVVDTNDASKEKIAQIAPSSRFTSRLNDVLNDAEVNAVILATPAETHFAVAKQCLESGKNLLVEKPIALSSQEALELLRIAGETNLRLMVGHVLLYHPAVVELKRLCDEGVIGKLQYIYSNRLNLGALRNEENILWSFAPHDISVIQYLVNSKPISVEAAGAVYVQQGIEDTTLTILKYRNNIQAHIFVSWLHPFKEQRLVVIGDKGMIVFEDSLPAEKLKLYPKGFRKTESGIEKFEGEYKAIPFANEQPLLLEQKHFFECIVNGNQPLTDGRHALEVLQILEQATQKIKDNE